MLRRLFRSRKAPPWVPLPAGLRVWVKVVGRNGAVLGGGSVGNQADVQRMIALYTRLAQRGEKVWMEAGTVSADDEHARTADTEAIAVALVDG